jgi:succinylglutamate desuccinylase
MEAILAAEPNLERLSVLFADNSKGLRRHIGRAMSSYTHMTMTIVQQFPDLDPDRDGVRAHLLEPAFVLEIGEVLQAARADLDKVAALSNDIEVDDERRAFREHVAGVSALYQDVGRHA